MSQQKVMKKNTVGRACDENREPTPRIPFIIKDQVFIEAAT